MQTPFQTYKSASINAIYIKSALNEPDSPDPYFQESFF